MYTFSKKGCNSSFCGDIVEMPFISVDNFEKFDRSGYFLSHYHFDHTFGLYKNELYTHLVANNVYIYTSEVTAAIIRNNLPKLKDYVRGLKLGTNTVSLKKNDNEEVFNVVLLPAAHCFGSVMFLFKIKDKTILYTGDFRMSRNSVSKYTHFHTKSGDPIDIDALYVDTTFQNVADFPTREETVEGAIMEMKKWISKSDNHCIALHTSANYGYEYVFNQIYEKLGMKVHVSNYGIWTVYRQFQEALPSVTNHEATRIHICREGNKKHSHRNCVPNDNTNVYLYIHFSAKIWNSYGKDEKFMDLKPNNRLNVCFATHNSRSELLYFINYLSPKRIVGFPDAFVKSPVKNVVGVPSPPKRKRVPFNIDRKVGNKVPQHILDDMF